MRINIFITSIIILLSTQIYSYGDTNLDDKIERHLEVQQYRPARHPNSEAVLISYKGWVYLKKDSSSPYEKIIPGEWPQWFRSEEDKNTIKFYIYLYTGIDANYELWLADVNGHLIQKVSDSKFFVTNPPQISSDGTKFVHIISPRHGAQGNEYSIAYFKINIYSENNNVKQEILYKTDKNWLGDLKWESPNRISFSESWVNEETQNIESRIKYINIE